MVSNIFRPLYVTLTIVTTIIVTIIDNIKNNPKMYILMYFKIQSDKPRITRNALKCQIFDHRQDINKSSV